MVIHPRFLGNCGLIITLVVPFNPLDLVSTYLVEVFFLSRVLVIVFQALNVKRNRHHLALGERIKLPAFLVTVDRERWERGETRFSRVLVVSSVIDNQYSLVVNFTVNFLSLCWVYLMYLTRYSVSHFVRSLKDDIIV